MTKPLSTEDYKKQTLKSLRRMRIVGNIIMPLSMATNAYIAITPPDALWYMYASLSVITGYLWYNSNRRTTWTYNLVMSALHSSMMDPDLKKLKFRVLHQWTEVAKLTRSGTSSEIESRLRAGGYHVFCVNDYHIAEKLAATRDIPFRQHFTIGRMVDSDSSLSMLIFKNAADAVECRLILSDH